MLEEKRNNKPDVVLKKYWENKERFSDFFNAVLFDGKTVIRPEELEDLDTDESSILEHKNYAETLKASRRETLIILQMQLLLHGSRSSGCMHFISRILDIFPFMQRHRLVLRWCAVF